MKSVDMNERLMKKQIEEYEELRSVRDNGRLLHNEWHMLHL